MKTIAVSGGFDPIHKGHIELLRAAKDLGGYLIVILNNDNWLRLKKGYAFMPQEQREEILRAIHWVDQVVVTKHAEDATDMSVCAELAVVGTDVFANGGDRKADNIPEYELCRRMGIEMAFGVGGEKIESSSQLVAKAMGTISPRPWGTSRLFAHADNYWLKALTLEAGKRTSLQKHEHRGELWMCVAGEVDIEVGNVRKTLRPFDAYRFGKGTVHRLGSRTGGTIVEIGYGRCDEADVERLEDDFNRP